ncbi:hypothetical protein DPMN_190618 [Dreissena polymorpha]|uniref:Uncharacterized protein n=1 Tax=Dreissena polymorpha TaxID=45954 RepID=A0A9D3Y2Q1_DREPO|nr:hypothetical protein DPMN_190618 [Dreissena polymorpha]
MYTSMLIVFDKSLCSVNVTHGYNYLTEKQPLPPTSSYDKYFKLSLSGKELSFTIPDVKTPVMADNTAEYNLYQDLTDDRLFSINISHKFDHRVVNFTVKGKELDIKIISETVLNDVVVIGESVLNDVVVIVSNSVLNDVVSNSVLNDVTYSHRDPEIEFDYRCVKAPNATYNVEPNMKIVIAIDAITDPDWQNQISYTWFWYLPIIGRCKKQPLPPTSSYGKYFKLSLLGKELTFTIPDVKTPVMADNTAEYDLYQDLTDDRLFSINISHKFDYRANAISHPWRYVNGYTYILFLRSL